MTTEKHRPPFLVQLKPSKNRQRLCLIIHVLALLASFANALPVAVKFALAALISFHFKIQYKQLNIEQHALRYTDKSGWEVSDGNDFQAIDILPSTVTTTFAIFLHSRNKPPLFIASDALNEDNYRQLIVNLKMTALHTTQHK